MKEKFPIDSGEDDHDETDILTDQDETDRAPINPDEDDLVDPIEEKFSGGVPDVFTRGEIDVKEQMDRETRASLYPNRANPPRPT